MIDKTIKNIKNTLRGFRGNIYSKNIRKKNTLQAFGGDTYSKNSKYKKDFFLSFLYIKGLDIKMSLISAKGYENAGARHLITKKLANFG